MASNEWEKKGCYRLRELGLASDRVRHSPVHPRFYSCRLTLEAALAWLVEHWQNVDIFCLGREASGREDPGGKGWQSGCRKQILSGI